MSQNVKFTLKVYETPEETLGSKIKIQGQGALLVAAIACVLVNEAKKPDSYLMEVMSAAVEVATEALNTDNPEEAIGEIIANRVNRAKATESVIDILKEINSILTK